MYSPINDDSLGERKKHCEYSVHKGSKDARGKGGVCSVAKIAVSEGNDEEDGDPDERGHQ